MKNSTNNAALVSEITRNAERCAIIIGNGRSLNREDGQRIDRLNARMLAELTDAEILAIVDGYGTPLFDALDLRELRYLAGERR